MEVLDFTPKSKTMQGFPMKPFKLMPLGDIQAGIDACDMDLLEREVDRALREDAYFIGMGDYLDVASPSNRSKMAKAGFYDSVLDMMDDRMREEEEKLLRVLAPTRGRWLGLLTGHHWWQYQDGTTTDTRLAKALDTVHLGTCAMLRLRFRDNSKHTLDCIIWAHHGVGGGVSAAAPITKLEKVMVWVEADLYLMGHQHKRVSAPQPRFYLAGGVDPILVAREKRLVGTGSYLKGYMQGSKKGDIATGTYVEQKMLAPVGLGSPIITIDPRRITKSGITVEELNIQVLA